MDITKQTRKTISSRIAQIIQRLESARADVPTWEPGDGGGWLGEDLMEICDDISDLAWMIDTGSLDVNYVDEDDDTSDDDEEEDDGVEELDAELDFEDPPTEEDD